MSLEDNNGTQYYFISCNVPSDVGIDLESNNWTGYYYDVANDYILYGQSDAVYPQPSNNNAPTTYYLLSCDVPSSPGLDLQANNGTSYYYNSAFNCVKWCEGALVLTILITESGEVFTSEYGKIFILE